MLGHFPSFNFSPALSFPDLFLGTHHVPACWIHPFKVRQYLLHLPCLKQYLLNTSCYEGCLQAAFTMLRNQPKPGRKH